jgi:hypothetical protein
MSTLTAGGGVGAADPAGAAALAAADEAGAAEAAVLLALGVLVDPLVVCAEATNE